MTPVLFDTDIGNDIDDAVALAYLLSQPECELVGITTATGDTAKRAALCEVICRAAGRTDIPIHAGLAGPLLHGREQGVAQYAAIENLQHRRDYPTGFGALEFLRNSIRSRPGELTLLAVGPLTNIGTLFAADPELPGLLKKIVLMCGRFVTGGPGAKEWNAFLDPIATALTYKHGAGKLLSVGLDVTLPCVMPATLVRERFAAAGGALVATLGMAEVWFSHSELLTFHDPLAAALLFAPELCGYQTGTISTVIEPGPLEGMTRWQADTSGPHEVATTVDAEAFFRHYFTITSR
nr:nucleoside hydrolase [Armatimonas sp.]